MKHETVGQFMAALEKTDNFDAKMLLKEWRKHQEEEEWATLQSMPLTEDTILVIRQQTSNMFAWRLGMISSERLYEMTLEAHVLFIQEIDALAGESGFIITEPRACISMSELMRHQGLVSISPDGVKLTRAGQRLVNREFDEE